MKTREIQSAPPWDATVRDLRDTFRDWGVGVEDWTVKALEIGPGVELVFHLPYDAMPHKIASVGQRYRERNLRAIFHHISAMQRDSLRGVHAEYGGNVYLALPPANDAEARDRYAQPTPKVRLPRSTVSLFRGMKDACAVLGVTEETLQEVVVAAWKALMRRERDNADAQKRLNAAKEFIYERRGWAVEQELAETT